MASCDQILSEKLPPCVVQVASNRGKLSRYLAISNHGEACQRWNSAPSKLKEPLVPNCLVNSCSSVIAYTKWNILLESAFSKRVMGKVKTMALLLLALLLLPTLVSPRHFNCANVCEQAGRGHPDRPSGTEVGLFL